MGRRGPNKTDEHMIEDHLDARGNTRRFRLGLYAANNFIEAVELRGDDEIGLRFVLPVPASAVPPWGKLRENIRRRLAQRFVALDSRGELQLLADTLEGRLSCAASDEEGRGPSMFIDDTEVSWEELGRLLRTFEGWNLRLEIRDLSA
jgi:hypothetical protein